MMKKPKRKCVYCKRSKEDHLFPPHSSYRDGLDTRCRKCIKDHREVRKQLRKTAPEKPSVCECCGKKPKKWCLDHDHKTHQFRGWICSKCNEGLGKFGDDLDGLIGAVNYLLMARGRNR